MQEIITMCFSDVADRHSRPFSAMVAAINAFGFITKLFTGTSTRSFTTASTKNNALHFNGIHTELTNLLLFYLKFVQLTFRYRNDLT